MVTKVTKEVVEVSRGEDTTPMRTKTRVVDPVVGVIGTNPPQRNFPPPFSSSGQDQGKNLRFDDVAAVFDNA